MTNITTNLPSAVLKYSILFSIISVSYPLTAIAKVDFDNYQPTLNGSDLSSPIVSGYENFKFTKVENPTNASEYKFVYYDYDNEQKTFPVYYQYSFNNRAVTIHNRVNNSATISNDSTNGYYFGRGIANCTSSVCGAAIYNGGTISNPIFGDFINNYSITSASSTTVRGGAVANSGSMGNITGDFIGNYIKDGSGNYTPDPSGGAAIFNSGTMGDIRGKFVSNYSDMYSNTGGGAILNNDSAAVINSIDGTFIGNYVKSSSSGTTYGGAIQNFNRATITEGIKGDFIGNHVDTSVEAAFGGAIYSNGKIGSAEGENITGIRANFSGNYVKVNADLGMLLGAGGGAVFSVAKTGIVSGDFVNNSVEVNNTSTSKYAKGVAQGGALYNGEETSEISGKFLGNYVSGTTEGSGGALYSTASQYSSSMGKAAKVSGEFVGNSALSSGAAYGGAIYNTATLTNVTGDFKNNFASSVSGNVQGGAIFNSSTLTTLSGNFDGNYAKTNSGKAQGGALYNVSNPLSKLLNASFTNNYAQTNSESTSVYLQGGAIYTNRNMTIEADKGSSTFTGNYVNRNGSKTSNAMFMDYSTGIITLNAINNGKIVFNDAIDGASGYTINVTGDSTGSVSFNSLVNNAKNVNVTNTNLNLGSYTQTDATMTNANGHGLFSSTTNLKLDNSVLTMDYASYQNLKLASITSDVKSYLSFGADFGAGESDKITAAVANGSINLKHIKVTGDMDIGDSITLFDNKFLNIANIGDYELISNNYAYTLSYNMGVLEITDKKIANYPLYNPGDKTLDWNSTDLDGQASQTGIIVNAGTMTVSSSDFSNNANTGNQYSNEGHGGVIHNKKDAAIDIVDSSFVGNTANGLGGAIYNAGTISVVATSKDVNFENNQSGAVANDIYMAEKSVLNLGVTNGKNISFNSGIDGDDGYKINISGDNTGSVNFNSEVKNVDTIAVLNTTLKLADEQMIDGANLKLDNGTLNLANSEIGQLNLASLASQDMSAAANAMSANVKGYIHLDVNPDNNTADMLNISGAVSGTTGLILNAFSENKPSESILFAQAASGNANSFEVYRVVGNPYEWVVSYADNRWYVGMPKEDPKNQNNNSVVSEVVAYYGLQSAAIEQTRSVVANVKSKVAANKILSNKCGVYDEKYDGQPLSNAWINPVYANANIEKPVDMKADITGFEAGFDIQSDANHKIGSFASYRQGNYDLSGKADTLHSKVKSEIDIDSYLGGLYYRFDKNLWWGFASVYGGVQQADIKAKDGINTDTDATQFGGNMEFGRLFALENNWSLEPSLGMSYTQISFDNIKDSVGKTAKYGNINQTEIEAGVKLEKTVYLDNGVAKYYFKPSVIQPITNNDSVIISGINKLDTYDDETLGRAEFGGRFALSESLSAYGFVNYTFGSNYDATSLGIGLNYSW